MVRVRAHERTFDFSDIPCESRARSIAVFIALVLEPPSFIEPSPPAEAPREVDAREPSVSEASPVTLRGETGAIVRAAPTSNTTNTPTALGWGARLVWGKRLGLSTGLSGFLPHDYRYARGTVRVVGARIDAALRGSLDAGRMTFFLELGPQLAWTSNRGQEVANARSVQRLEVVAKTRGGARWNLTRNAGVFVALHTALVPRPANYLLNPDEYVGSAPSLWFGAQLGLSFAISPSARLH